MYDCNSLNVSTASNTCYGCLKINGDVRAMTIAEENAYREIVKNSNPTSSLFVCTFCGHLLKKFNKFVQQCHEASRIISSSLEDSKSQLYLPPLQLTHNLIVTHPYKLDILENDDLDDMPTFEDNAFDDEDVPLVMLKKENEKIKKKKKKVKHKQKEVKKLQEDVETFIKTEELNMEETHGQANEIKVKCKKPKKELKEGFSSRMVQETVEYVVIKLSKEQVLKEMSERAASEQYQRTLYKCTACVKGFNFEDVLRTHMEKHARENGAFQCEICTQYCPSAVSLRGHMKSHTTRYQCKVCGCVRQARQHLLEHHAAHARAPPRYACTRCAFATAKRTSMQRHVKSHLPAERHACHQCGKLFKSLETLRVHTMRHDKSSRLQCEACGRVFIYPSLLHAHVQAVHVRNDYYCVECDAGFKSRENLRLHFKKAKKHRDTSSFQYECTQCPARFASASGLTSHVSRDHRLARAKRRCDGAEELNNIDQIKIKPATAFGSLDTHCEKMDDNNLPDVKQPIMES